LETDDARRRNNLLRNYSIQEIITVIQLSTRLALPPPPPPYSVPNTRRPANIVQHRYCDLYSAIVPCSFRHMDNVGRHCDQMNWAHIPHIWNFIKTRPDELAILYRRTCVFLF
jgi:hypothetical protein